MLIMLALLTAIQPVEKKGRGDWVTPDDYPQSALRKNEAGFVGFSILVDPNGRNENCKVTEPSPFSDLNDLTCVLVMRRAHFTPAIGDDGQPAYGLFRSWASWMVAEDRYAMDRLIKSHPHPSGVDFTASAIAQKLPDPVDLVIDVSASGVIGDCQGKGISLPTETAELACQQLTAGWKPPSGVTLAGKAVSTVQTVTVNFRLDDAAATKP